MIQNYDILGLIIYFKINLLLFEFFVLLIFHGILLD